MAEIDPNGMNSGHFNDATMRAQLVHEEVNSAYNHHIIINAFKSGRAKDISDEQIEKGKPCFIIGSGADLDDAVEHLKNWKGGIICTTSHALTLIKNDIVPTYIMALDPFCSWDEIKGIPWEQYKTKLITHPGVWPDLIENWPNEFLMFIENIGTKDSFYANTQKRMYTWREGENRRCPTFNYYIRTELTLFACSPPAQLFAVDRMGYGTIFLAGIDFGIVNGKERFSNWTKDEQGEWQQTSYPFDEKVVSIDPGKKIMYANNGVPTFPGHIFYKKNFLSAWRLSHKTIYSTDHGAMTEIPFVPITEVIEKQGEGFSIQSVEGINEICDNYLASVNCFVVESNAGSSFIECQNPASDIPNFINTIKNSYVCSVCGIRATSNDGRDCSGVDCKCGKGKLQHLAIIDEEKNYARFEKALGRKLFVVHPIQPPDVSFMKGGTN